MKLVNKNKKLMIVVSVLLFYWHFTRNNVTEGFEVGDVATLKFGEMDEGIRQNYKEFLKYFIPRDLRNSPGSGVRQDVIVTDNINRLPNAEFYFRKSNLVYGTSAEYFELYGSSIETWRSLSGDYHNMENPLDGNKLHLVHTGNNRWELLVKESASTSFREFASRTQSNRIITISPNGNINLAGVVNEDGVYSEQSGTRGVNFPQMEIIYPQEEPEEPEAPEPEAPEPVAPEPVAPEPVAGKPVAGKPVAGKPVAPTEITVSTAAKKPVFDPTSISGQQRGLQLMRGNLKRVKPQIIPHQIIPGSPHIPM